LLAADGDFDGDAPVADDHGVAFGRRGRLGRRTTGDAEAEHECQGDASTHSRAQLSSFGGGV
jgi:hypothetical protein